MEEFEIISEIKEIQTIAVGSSIKDLNRLRKIYGKGRWRKLKGTAIVRIIKTDNIYFAELHWYEAHGIGKKDIKIKRKIR